MPPRAHVNNFARDFANAVVYAASQMPKHLNVQIDTDHIIQSVTANVNGVSMRADVWEHAPGYKMVSGELISNDAKRRHTLEAMRDLHYRRGLLTPIARHYKTHVMPDYMTTEGRTATGKEIADKEGIQDKPLTDQVIENTNLNREIEHPLKKVH